jgi:hypothetical protein
MKTLSQFIADNNGKHIEEVDPSAFNQCKDVAQRYIKEVWGLAYLPFGNAYNMFALAQSDLYDKVINSYFAIPKAGDVIVWGQKLGQYGHIGIVTSANLFWFNCFEQNDPLGSVCHVKRYSYYGVIGWFRSKVKQSTEQMIRTFFKQSWGREPFTGEVNVFLNRLKKKNITVSQLEEKIKYCYDKRNILEQKEKGSGDKYWDEEKRKWNGT